VGPHRGDDVSADDRTPAPLTPASRKALAHYRKRAEECRADAARWDALADELEAFGEQTEHHEGQGELL
jgi:hypothetical protein